MNILEGILFWSGVVVVGILAVFTFVILIAFGLIMGVLMLVGFVLALPLLIIKTIVDPKWLDPYLTKVRT